MFNMLLGLFGNSFTDLLGQSSFWFSLAGIIGLIIVVVICIKYPKIGGPLLLSMFGIVLVGLDIYCILQLNNYYTAEGGIHGKITGIFNPNEIEVVDNLTFEVKNIELTESKDGLYSASILSDEVLSLDTRESLGVFVNGVPCDTTSEVDKDYAIANYKYTFYDNDKSEICTDTLILNFAFYENSTYLSLSTKGGTLPVEECVNYWHHYFNKNGFVIKIAPFIKVSNNIENTNGNTSNYAVIRYFVDNELYKTDCKAIGSTYTLDSLNIEGFSGWVDSNGMLLGDKIILNNSIDLHAEYTTSYEYMVTYVVDEETSLYPVTSGAELPKHKNPSKAGSLFLGWSLDGSTVLDLTNYVVTSDVKFIAVFDETVGLYSLDYKLLYSWDELITNEYVSFSDGELTDFNDSLVGRLVIPSVVTTISVNCFRSCNLSEIVIGSGVTRLENYSFASCKLLESIYIPSNVTTIGNNVFSSCSNLKNIEFEDTVTLMGSGVFSSCNSLTEITLPKSIDYIPAMTFSNCLSLENVVVPSNIKSINALAFWGCANLKTLYIPNSVETIKSDNYYDSIVYESSSSLTIYCGSESKLTGWGNGWNYITDSETVNVKYGYTYEEYLLELNS